MKKISFVFLILLFLCSCGKQEKSIFFTQETNNVIKTGETQKIKYTLQGIKDSSKLLTWSSSNTDVAVVTQEGFILALSPGTVVISLFYNDNNAIKASKTITVVNLFINSPLLNLKPGMQTYLTTRSNFNATELSWESSDPGIANISSVGFLSCYNSGTVTIKVYSIANPAYFDTIDLYIEEITPILNITGNYDIYVNQTISLNTYSVPSSNNTIFWESLDDTKATIDEAGMLTAHSLGTVIIQASLDGFSSLASVEINIIERITYDAFGQIEQLYKQQLYEKDKDYLVFVYDSGKDNTLIQDTIIDYLNLRNDFLNINSFVKIYAFNTNNINNVSCVSDDFAGDDTAWRTSFEDLKVPIYELPMLLKVSNKTITQSIKTKNTVLESLIQTMENASYDDVTYRVPNDYPYYQLNNSVDSHIRVISKNEKTTSGSIKTQYTFGIITKNKYSSSSSIGSSALSILSNNNRVNHFNTSLSLSSYFSLTSTSYRELIPQDLFVDINYTDDNNLTKYLKYKTSLIPTPLDLSIFGDTGSLPNIFSISSSVIPRLDPDSQLISSYDVGVLYINISNKLTNYTLDFQMWVDTEDFGLLPLVGIYNYSDNAKNIDIPIYTPIYSYFKPKHLYMTCSYTADSETNTLYYKKLIGA